MLCLAVNLTTVLAGTTMNITDVEATADGDTTATIPHGLGAAPEVVILTGLQVEAETLSQWAATTINATNVVLTKQTDAGSGVAGAQLRCIAMLPHSIIQ